MYGSFSESTLKDFYEFTRCVKPSGKAYGTSGQCRLGVEEEKEPPKKRGAKKGGMRITSKIKGMASEDLKKVLKDPRLNDKQRKLIEGILRERIGENTSARGEVRKRSKKLRNTAEQLSPKSEVKTKGPSDEQLKKLFNRALYSVDRLNEEGNKLSKEGVKWNDPRAKALAERRARAEGALTTIRQAYHAVDREGFLKASAESIKVQKEARKLREESEKEAKEKGLNVYTLPDDHPLKKKFLRSIKLEDNRQHNIQPRVKAAFYGEPSSLTKAPTDGGGEVSSSVPSGLPRGGASGDLRDFLEGSSVVMAFPVSGFTKFVKDGEAKNGFERGTGGIKTGKSGYLSVRKEGEETVLGIPSGADPKGRPVYAALEHPDRTRSLQGGSFNEMADYGGIQVILRPSVKDRSTFTVGDSLDYAADRKIKASPVRDPSNPTIVNSAGSREVEFDPGGGKSSNEMVIRGRREDVPYHPPYVEAQIHGGLKLTDVQEVRYYKGNDIPSSTRRLLEQQGIRIIELPPQMNSLVHYAESPGFRDITGLSKE